MLVAAGYQVTGVDYSTTALAQARQRTTTARFHLGAVPHALPALIASQRPTAAVACELLEHITEDLAVLDLLRAHSIPLVATLPAFDDAGHVRYFTHPSRIRARYGVEPTPIGPHHWGIVVRP